MVEQKIVLSKEAFAKLKQAKELSGLRRFDRAIGGLLAAMIKDSSPEELGHVMMREALGEYLIETAKD